jgi:cellulose synthase/poly-beta-1,6-N-acetylglucosamine synthase-like glycosyltransferase
MIVDLFVWGIFIFSVWLFFWMFLGYPLALGLIQKIHPRPIIRGKDTPLITVIVCTYNESKTIERRLSNLIASDYPYEKMEIIVVDSNSPDGTGDIVQNLIHNQDGMVHLIRETDRRGKVSAINLGLAAAKGEFVILTDGPTIFKPDTIRFVVENFADASVGAVTGNFVKYDLDGEIQSQETEWVVFNYRKILRRLEAMVDSTTWLSGELTAFRRSLIPNIPSSVIIDDAYIAMAIREQGYRVVVDERALYTEKRPAIYKETVTIKMKSVTGSIQEMVRFRKMLFNIKYKWYGILILPARLLHFYLNPLILLAILGSGGWMVVESFGFLPVFVIGGSMLVVLLILYLYKGGILLRPIKAFLLMEWIIILGIYKYLTGNYSATWKQVKSTRQ